VAPHPDDETIGCGGALALHARAGDRTTVLFVTDGRRSRAFSLTPDEMARRRREEAARASEALGAAHVWLGLREGEWSDIELRDGAAHPLDELRPSIVYAPSCVDFHPEHVRVARVLAPLLARVAPSARVRVYPVQVPLGRTLANLVVPMAGVEDAFERALGAYETQAGNAPGARRRRRYAGAAHRAGGPAEELWELTAAAYARVHDGDIAAFRGLRPFPATDPLAYLAGGRARRALLRKAG
jgi:LmbE family N-acetylglucosaminyl deacetylase